MNDDEINKKEQERLLHNSLVYMKIYDSLIERAIPRGLKKDNSDLGFTEIHHIVPRCMGGTDDVFNLVQLTTREHIIVHMLLQRMYPNNYGLSLAVTLMFSSRDTSKFSSKTISSFKEKYRKILKNNPISISEEAKRKMSKAKKGKPGRKQTEETKKKLRERIISDETREKMSKAKKGRKLSEETKEKLRILNLGRKHSENTKEKLRNLSLGNKYNLGKKLSEETKEKLRIASSGRKHSVETRKKISESRKGIIYSEETRKKMSESKKGKKTTTRVSGKKN